MAYQPYFKCPVCNGRDTIVIEHDNADDNEEVCVECGTALSEFIESRDWRESEKTLYLMRYVR